MMAISATTSSISNNDSPDTRRRERGGRRGKRVHGRATTGKRAYSYLMSAS
jgi:hypothetical protein